MKTLRAEKLNNDWLITITDKIQVSHETDVLKIIRENGLLVRGQFSHREPTEDNKNIWLYAD